MTFTPPFSAGPQFAGANDSASQSGAAGTKTTTILLLSGVVWFVAHVVVELVAHILIGLPVFGMAAPVI
ncbi:hypothetical protein DB346_20845 [Verrucomicrobia bacterium LW23]|nr:hypothetical protein DB346_20845 [Verrucomicrobia bacterium LW23]